MYYRETGSWRPSARAFALNRPHPEAFAYEAGGNSRLIFSSFYSFLTTFRFLQSSYYILCASYPIHRSDSPIQGRKENEARVRQDGPA